MVLIFFLRDIEAGITEEKLSDPNYLTASLEEFSYYCDTFRYFFLY